MPAFVETYSANMRAALFRATIDDKMTVKGALRAAQAGQLPDLPADDQRILAGMTYNHAASIVKDERLRRGAVERVRDDVHEAAHELAARLAALADRETAQLEAEKPKTPVDTGRALAAAKLMDAAVTLADKASGQGKTNGKGAAPATEQPKAPRSLVARIAAEAGAEDGNAPTHTDAGGDNGAAGASETTEQTDGNGARPVRLRAASPASVGPGQRAV
jgi:hypothetical protein